MGAGPATAGAGVPRRGPGRLPGGSHFLPRCLYSTRDRRAKWPPQPCRHSTPRPEKDLGRGPGALHSYCSLTWHQVGRGEESSGLGSSGRRFLAAHWRLSPALRSLHALPSPPLLPPPAAPRASRRGLRRSKVGANPAGPAPRPADGREGPAGRSLVGGVTRTPPAPPAAKPRPPSSRPRPFSSGCTP